MSKSSGEVSRRSVLAGAGAVSAGALASGVMSGRAGAASPVVAPDARVGRVPAAPRCDQLRQTGPGQDRFLTLPMSRVTINPRTGTVSESLLDYSTGPELPLHVSYWAADTPYETRDMASVYRVTGATGSITAGFRDDFSSTDSGWTASPGLVAAMVGGYLQLTNSTAAPTWFGTYQRTIPVNLDQTPYLQISVISLADAFGLTVNNGSGSEVIVQPDTQQVGVFTYDLKQITGWSGTQQVHVTIRVAIKNKPAEFDYFRFAGVTPAVEQSETQTSEWVPYEVPTTATYASGSEVQFHDFLYDVNTVARTMSFRPATGARRWRIAGFFRGTAEWDAASGALVVSTDTFSYAVMTSARAIGKASLYPTLLELVSGSGAVATLDASGYWAFDVNLPRDNDLVLGIGFATNYEGGAKLAVRRATAVTRGWRAPRPDMNKAMLDQMLADVPRPQSFALPGIDPRGTTPEQVRRMYYTAWVQLLVKTLPPQPEAGIRYPQIAAAKPSSYPNGPAGARASAPWDSLLGMQFYAYYDPKVAWQAFIGMMSLVPADGLLGGEALPSRKAQTAWVLYQLTGDKNSLHKIYPALRRYLIWAAANPRWILPGHTNDPTSRDAEFAFSALVDMQYARQIAAVLGIKADLRFWDTQTTNLVAQSYQWFWTTPTAPTQEYYTTTTGARQAGATLYTTTGLHARAVDGEYVQGLLARFNQQYDPTQSFCGFSVPKYPDLSYTAYGLLDHGLAQQANILVSENARDVARAGLFAEVYNIYTDPPTASGDGGLFGIAAMIDSVWMVNGYRYDQGWPAVVRLDADDNGGIWGLRVRGHMLNTALKAGSDTVTVAGNLLRRTHRLTVPVGATVSVPTR